MPLFHVLVGSEVVGSSSLEFGDPPMGVAFGKFNPNERYSRLRALATADETIQELKFELRAPDGTVIPCQGGVCIQDLSEDLGPEAMEVEALGIPYPLYEKLFPEHVQAYKAQFP